MFTRMLVYVTQCRMWVLYLEFSLSLKHCLYRASDRPFLEVERTTQDGGPFNTVKVGVSLYPIWLLYKACISRTSQITARRIDLSAQNSKFCGEKYTQFFASVH